jgi:hypothetical protein
MLTNTDALRAWLDTSSGSWNSTLTKMVQPYNDTEVPLSWYAEPHNFK